MRPHEASFDTMRPPLSPPPWLALSGAIWIICPPAARHQPAGPNDKFGARESLWMRPRGLRHGGRGGADGRRRFGGDHHVSPVRRNRLPLDQRHHRSIREPHQGVEKGVLCSVAAVPRSWRGSATAGPFPSAAIGLSVDDAYLSVYPEAWPRLKGAGLPMTLFVATRAVDRKLSGS